jgi:hypothetical protein
MKHFCDQPLREHGVNLKVYTMYIVTFVQLESVPCGLCTSVHHVPHGPGHKFRLINGPRGGRKNEVQLTG